MFYLSEATTKRARPTDTRTLRRRTSTRNRRESSARRQSTTHDVQVAMMPDLSENLSNEQTTWEEIMQIKAMPVPMIQKKELKAKLQVNTIHLFLIYSVFFFLGRCLIFPPLRSLNFFASKNHKYLLIFFCKI